MALVVAGLVMTAVSVIVMTAVSVIVMTAVLVVVKKVVLVMVMTATWVMAAFLVMTAVSVMVMRCEADLPQGGRGVHRVRHRARVRDHSLRRAGGAHPPPPGLLHENARGVFIA